MPTLTKSARLCWRSRGVSIGWRLSGCSGRLRPATRLPDAAKCAVEIAIEDSEAAALAHLATVNPPDAAA